MDRLVKFKAFWCIKLHKWNYSIDRQSIMKPCLDVVLRGHVILSVLFAPHINNLCGGKQRPPKWEQAPHLLTARKGATDTICIGQRLKSKAGGGVEKLYDSKRGRFSLRGGCGSESAGVGLMRGGAPYIIGEAGHICLALVGPKLRGWGKNSKLSV